MLSLKCGCVSNAARKNVSATFDGYVLKYFRFHIGPVLTVFFTEMSCYISVESQMCILDLRG